MISLLWGTWHSQTQRDRKWQGVARGWGGERQGLVFMGTECQLRREKEVLEMDGGDTAQQCACARCH